MKLIKEIINSIIIKEENQSLKKDLNYQESIIKLEMAKTQILRRAF